MQRRSLFNTNASNYQVDRIVVFRRAVQLQITYN